VIWLNPAAWIGLVALAAPILIHILVQRRAERLPFPSLRFLQQTRLASIRRHVLEDLPLLAIRAAILAAAVAALAGPLVITPTQRQAWNARVVRATVISGADGALQPSDRTFLSQTFETRSVSDGLHRALAWLDNAPPARRELVIVGPLGLGSVTAEDLSAVPPAIGLRFERSGTLPTERTIDGGKVLGPVVHQQTVALKGVTTSVRETVASAPVGFPVDVVCAADARPAVDAAIAAVRSERVWAPAADRRARLVLIGTSVDSSAIADARPVTVAWTADAMASVTRDPELQAEASEAPAGLRDRRFATAPWQTLVSASDGHPLAAAAGTPAGFVVVSGAESSSLVTALLLRAIANGIAVPPDLRTAEVLPIPDAQLQSWTRPAAPVTTPRIDRVERDDRRGLWALVLGLLALEMWVRRARPAGAIAPPQEDARVA
jgi:Aerotolerance regulator N-terminal